MPRHTEYGVQRSYWHQYLYYCAEYGSRQASLSSVKRARTGGSESGDDSRYQEGRKGLPGGALRVGQRDQNLGEDAKRRRIAWSRRLGN